jgi:tryptophanyl-tRNA synthetase
MAEHPQHIWDILEAGTQRARSIAQETMREVRDAIGLP